MNSKQASPYTDIKYRLLSMDSIEFYEKLDNNDQELLKQLKQMGNGLIETGIRFYESQRHLYQKKESTPSHKKDGTMTKDIQDVVNAQMQQSPKNTNTFYQIFGNIVNQSPSPAQKSKYENPQDDKYETQRLSYEQL